MFDLLLRLADHLAPIFITLVLVIVIVFFVIGRPYLKYIQLVANAGTPDGIEALAKHLAHKSGGRHINVDAEWVSFVPAAEAIYKSYLRNLNP